MSVLSMPPHHYLLIVHEGSGAAMWDLRAQVVVAVANGANGTCSSSNDDSSDSQLAAITAAVWLPGSSKGDFATGHRDGAVCIWEMPASAGSNGSSSSNSTTKQAAKLSGDAQHQQQQHSMRAQLVAELQVGSSSRNSTAGGSSPRHQGRKHSSRCRPVKTLEFVAGPLECLAVFGGDEVDRPDGLTLLPLPEPAQVCSLAPWHRLPLLIWHGCDWHSFVFLCSHAGLKVV